MASLGIYEALKQIRDDIRRLQEDLATSNAKPMFAIESCDVELKVVARTESSAKAGGKASVKLVLLGELGGRAEGEIGQYAENVQTIRIKLVGASKEPPVIGMAFGRSSESGETDMPVFGPKSVHNQKVKPKKK